ncbi:MAG TPA: MotA/TolQ/ExbB proton channel family protein [Candidatus Fermentibacter daniensis]|nr:MAG: Biopolymer transport protein ExbB [candidate division Hyd24-12 bacterium ADurb.Bin004]HPH38995.1 MotA/TolQ/ExbB proton channel family protein [Candidatus Fermentibacter daniensis]HPN62029.1 MotA/TolQ/ExbB proton channel family protein [Candidatus Fermentibacter daniensis]
MGKVIEVLGQSDFVTTLILITILILSVGSWAVAVAKLREFRKVLSSSRLFMDALRTTGKPPGGDFWSRSREIGPLARMYAEAGHFLQRRSDAGITGSLDADEAGLLRSSLEREAGEDLAERERNIGFLATVTSISPLLGLLGTVWGILTSFIGMKEYGTADLSVIGAGVANALTTTVAGLLAAIPANIFHNFVVGRINSLAGDMDRFLSELVDVCRRGSL